MIPTRIGARLLALALASLLAACTNSKLLIGPLYGQLDDRMLKQFNGLADWSDTQQREYRTRVKHFHLWHRRSELPLYAALLDSVAGVIENPAASDEEGLTLLFESVETLSQRVRECHPINYSFDLMRSLTPEQLESIESTITEKRGENRERYKERSASERVDHRLGNMDKWARRIGVEFTAEQRAMLRTALTRQISLRNEYYALSDTWNDELFALLRSADQAGFDERMTAHLQRLWSLLEDAHSEEWSANRRLWRQTAWRLLQSLDENQRDAASSWLTRMADTLAAVARDDADRTLAADADVGCSPDRSSDV